MPYLLVRKCQNIIRTIIPGTGTPGLYQVPGTGKYVCSLFRFLHLLSSLGPPYAPSRPRPRTRTAEERDVTSEHTSTQHSTAQGNQLCLLALSNR